MDDVLIVLVLLLIPSIIFGGFTAFVAKEKGRDGTVWFWLGFFFSLVALIAICGVPTKNLAATVDSSEADQAQNPKKERLDIAFD